VNLKGWRTVLFNILALGVTSPDIAGLLPPRIGLYVVVIGNLILRAITSTNIGRKE